MSSTPYLRFQHFTHLEITYPSIFKNSAKPLCILHWSSTFAQLAVGSRVSVVSFCYRAISLLSLAPHSPSHSVGLHGFGSIFQRTCCRYFFLLTSKLRLYD